MDSEHRTYRFNYEGWRRMFDAKGIEKTDYFLKLYQLLAPFVAEAYDIGRDGRDLSETYPFVSRAE